MPDSHCGPEYDNTIRALWLSSLIDDLRPSTIVHLGDNWNLDSCSDFDLDKPQARISRNYKADIASGHDFLAAMFSSTTKARQRYSPHTIYCLGNHDIRIQKVVDRQPELAGTISLRDLDLRRWFGQVAWYEGKHPSVVVADGIAYCHYAVAGLMCRPISGLHNLAHSLLTKLHTSTIVGHSHILSYANQVVGNGTKRIHGLSAGVYVDADAKFDFVGVGARQWNRGLAILRDVDGAGDFDFQWVSIRQIQRLYG